MDKSRSAQWTDGNLRTILNETGNWVVRGQQGQALCAAASLQRAIQRATQFARSGAVVAAICRLAPSEDIIVFPGQIERLRKSVVMREAGPLKAA